MALLQLLLISLFLCEFSYAQKAGGLYDIKTVPHGVIHDIEKFENAKVVKVIRAQQQVVAGLFYFLHVKMAKYINGHRLNEECHFKIFYGPAQTIGKIHTAKCASVG